MRALIAVDLLWLVPGRVGGSEEYAVRTLLSYARHGSSDLRPVVFLSDQAAEEHPDLGRFFDLETRPLANQRRWRRVAAEMTWLAGRVRRLDAVHHFGGRIPIRTGRRVAVTVHDLQPLDHPENFSMAKRYYLGRALPRSIQRADLVVTVSELVGEAVGRRFGVDGSRLATVSAGVKCVASTPTTPVDPPTVLYPAATYPHKRHELLIRAFEYLADDHPTVRLLLTGGAGRSESAIRNSVASSRHLGRIDRPGRIPARDLAERMRDATVVAFPSAYEGFGLPVLEAMAAGVPVLVADGTPAADLTGPRCRVAADAGALEWASRLRTVLDDVTLRQDLAVDGLERATAYGCEATAEALDQAWRRLVGHRRY
ncbi:MAG TPA: hypothetical protein DCR10_01285 [Acidimicrobiaceae bacterium]|nr:hypothetical protein [Acidimicrobiaceae bacterium]